MITNTKHTLVVDSAELGTILAALRLRQAWMSGDGIDARRDDLEDIATDGGEILALDDGGIDALCLRLNGEDPDRAAIAALIGAGELLVAKAEKAPELDAVDLRGAVAGVARAARMLAPWQLWRRGPDGFEWFWAGSGWSENRGDAVGYTAVERDDGRPLAKGERWVRG